MTNKTKNLIFCTVLILTSLQGLATEAITCAFGDNSADLIDDIVPGIKVESHRIILSASGVDVRFPEGTQLIQVSTLSELEKVQILKAIKLHSAYLSTPDMTLNDVIADTDDSFVNLLTLRHIKTGDDFYDFYDDFSTSNSLQMSIWSRDSAAWTVSMTGYVYRG